MGSPPRVRGKDGLFSASFTGFRITPACAGKSRDRPRLHHGSGDHPRVCGEKAVRVIVTMDFTGSPPRVRGKDPLLSFYIGVGGITPACAGKSVSATVNDCKC